MSKVEKTAQAANSAVRHFVAVAIVLACIWLILQILVLAIVGPKGAEITQIRDEKDSLRIENEYIRSQIDRSKTLARIGDGLNEVFDLQPASVEQVSALAQQGS